MGFPCGSAEKESTCNAGDLGSIPGFGRSPGEGKGYPLQYSGLENSMDCIVHGVSKRTQLNDFHSTSLQAHAMQFTGVFPGGTSGKEPICQCRKPKRYMCHPWAGKIPWRRAWKGTLVFLPGELHGQGAWWATVHGVAKSWA